MFTRTLPQSSRPVELHPPDHRAGRISEHLRLDHTFRLERVGTPENNHERVHEVKETNSVCRTHGRVLLKDPHEEVGIFGICRDRRSEKTMAVEELVVTELTAGNLVRLPALMQNREKGRNDHNHRD